jgi:hypothetical protein
MPESREKNHLYANAVQNALFTFQMIEEALKIHIGLSYEILKRTAPLPVAFNFDTSAIRNAPLGKLIKLFSGITANRQLVSDLSKIVEWRNFCAHRAYKHEFMSRMSSTPVSPNDVTDVLTITAFSVSLVEQLGNEMRTLRDVHLALFGKDTSQDGEV